ncbi:restriction endonuclease subunit S [Escherichia coli]
MSVDTLRETFHINRISTSDLQDFLTAQTYRPEITQAKNHILSLKNCSLQAVCTKPIQQGKSPKYAEKGLKCIKPKNTNDMLVSIDDIDWIDSSTKDQIQKQKLAYGDIVITRSGSGTIGRASIYCYSEEAYTNDHLFVVRPDKADSHYICSFLNSFHGQRLLEAGVSGSTGQLNLSNEHIKSIPLFRPEHKAQKYIGDKVRQAEQLRAWAKRLEGMADRKIKDLFHFNLVDSLTLKPRRMKQQVLSAVSLAPEFARAADSQMTFRNSSKLSNFISKCKCGDPIKSEERVPGPYFYYGASGPIDTHTEFNFNGKYLIIAQDGSIGCANVADGKFWANNHVWVLKVKDEYDIESICRFLDKHFPCWKGVTTGSVVLMNPLMIFIKIIKLR